MINALGAEKIAPDVMIDAALHILAAWVVSIRSKSTAAEREADKVRAEVINEVPQSRGSRTAHSVRVVLLKVLRDVEEARENTNDEQAVFSDQQISRHGGKRLPGASVRLHETVRSQPCYLGYRRFQTCVRCRCTHDRVCSGS